MPVSSRVEPVVEKEPTKKPGKEKETAKEKEKDKLKPAAAPKDHRAKSGAPVALPSWILKIYGQVRLCSEYRSWWLIVHI
jgi:hypothetical protein